MRLAIQRRVDNEPASKVLSCYLNPGDKVMVVAEEGILSFEVLEETALMGTTGGDKQAGRRRRAGESPVLPASGYGIPRLGDRRWNLDGRCPVGYG